VGIKLFNKLPNTIKRIERPQEFKMTRIFPNATRLLVSRRIHVLLRPLLRLLVIMHFPFYVIIPLKHGTRKSYTNMYVSSPYYITVSQEQIKGIRVAVQDWPLDGASGALAPGADFERAPRRRSLTGHTISSTIAW
jgi:hypothetical protein